MTANDLLTYALLAMDSYHRGANGGLNGNELLDGSRWAIPASAIDGWTIILSTPPEQSNTSGFSATAYQKNNDIVIAYRGTDDGFELNSSGDIVNGYGIAFASPDGAQARAAMAFYRQVAEKHASTTNPYEANIVVTGHSLGGGIAGFVSAIRGAAATLHNHMPEATR